MLCDVRSDGSAYWASWDDTAQAQRSVSTAVDNQQISGAQFSQYHDHQAHAKTAPMYQLGVYCPRTLNMWPCVSSPMLAGSSGLALWPCVPQAVSVRLHRRRWIGDPFRPSMYWPEQNSLSVADLPKQAAYTRPHRLERTVRALSVRNSLAHVTQRFNNELPIGQFESRWLNACCICVVRCSEDIAKASNYSNANASECGVLKL